MKEELYKDERTAIMSELRDKYKLYADTVRKNRLDTHHVHKQYCQSENHRQCGAKWGHADIMKETIGRIWWWFTGEQLHSIRIAHKPKLQHIAEQIFKQRGENELEDTEYYWLMKIKDRCKKMLANCTEQKSQKSVLGDK